VVRYNSLAVKESIEVIETQSPLVVTAIEKGNSMIMALKHKTLPFSGVQFHPESFLTDKAEEMIENFFKDHIDD
jgi:anthranilate/para-aminobenzoate synthase component II